MYVSSKAFRAKLLSVDRFSVFAVLLWIVNPYIWPPPPLLQTPPPPLQQIPSQRNSNLRELPIATSNNNRPPVPSGQAKPVTRATQNVRQGQPARAGPAGRGGSVAQGQGAAKAPEQPSVPEMKKECPAAQSSTTPEVILRSVIMWEGLTFSMFSIHRLLQ